MCYKILTLYIFLIFCTDKSSVMSLWDFAATAEDKIIFFDNDWNEISQAAHQFTKLSGLAFDEIEEKLYFSDQSHNNGSVFSLKLPNNINGINSNSGQINGVKGAGERKIEIIEKIVARIDNETIGGITYDPYERYLYWSDKSNKKIYRLYTSSLNLKNHSNTPEIFLNLNNDSLPEGITIDICNRLLYWTNSNIKNPSIERISLENDFRNSEIIIDDDLFQPRGIITDQYSNRLYWVVNLPGIHYAIESSNLDGTDRKKIYAGLHNEPYDLTVTKDNIFYTDIINEAIWKISKSADSKAKPIKVYTFKDRPRGIISRIGLLTKFANKPECKKIISSIKDSIIKYKEHINNHTKTLLNNSSILLNSMHPDATATATTMKTNQFCLNNGEYNPLSDACICKVGYSGLNCELNDCTNYCVHGTCEISSMGFPECICNDGFYGIRCEAFKCLGYCLNDGYCKIKNDKPICECQELYNGDRCEQNSTEICTLFCSILKYNPNQEIPLYCHDICNQMNEFNNTDINLNNFYNNLKINNAKSQQQHLLQEQQSEKYDNNLLNSCNNNNLTIILLISISILLLIVISILFSLKVCKKFKPPRPKIRKTFVVKQVNGNYRNTQNDGSTPLTRNTPLSAVERCEITIENCCNMNICETPCFDPKVLQQTFGDNYSTTNCSSKNEDKKTLVDNMEDNLY